MAQPSFRDFQSAQFRHYFILLVMLLAAGAAILLKPTQRIADQGPKVDLETMTPKQFRDWHIDEAVMPLIADPKQTVTLQKIYAQTLARTYVNGKGERIMLSIAYGTDQSDTMQVHKPEVCYPAQGFPILGKQSGTLGTLFGAIPITRLVAKRENVIEPITYWISVAGEVGQTDLQRKLVKLKYAITGHVPDGVLVRISSIAHTADDGYRVQDTFANELLAAVSPDDRKQLSGLAAR